MTNIIELSSLDGNNGFVINGIDEDDGSGRSVSSAGDVNGDGFDDILIGAPNADPNGNYKAGESYVVFGSGNPFNPSLNLSSLDGTNGFVINGSDLLDQLGSSVSSAGDVNGDGFDDILIGASWADPNGNTRAGESYVVFGSSSGFGSSLDLSSLDKNDGFVINGIKEYNQSGSSVSSAGDVNGDGFDDILIGAERGDPNGNSYAGESYVVFGFSVTPTVPTPGDDVLTGTSDNDLIRALPGNDLVNAGDGNDTVGAGSGNDTIDGGAGNDVIRGGTGRDSLDGGAGTDNLQGGSGSDTLNGGDDDDTLKGEKGADFLHGDNGNDFITGGNGKDLLTGGLGTDDLRGGNGNDTLDGGDDDDTLNGGKDDDSLTGGLGSDFLDGKAGNDILIGVDSSAAAPGTGELDNLRGGGGVDTFILGDATTAYYLGGGDADYARIRTFDPDRDTIQLSGSEADYTLNIIGWDTEILHDGDRVGLLINDRIDDFSSGFSFV